jgi:hypothetical protein
MICIYYIYCIVFIKFLSIVYRFTKIIKFRKLFDKSTNKLEKPRVVSINVRIEKNDYDENEVSLLLDFHSEKFMNLTELVNHYKSNEIFHLDGSVSKLVKINSKCIIFYYL